MEPQQMKDKATPASYHPKKPKAEEMPEATVEGREVLRVLSETLTVPLTQEEKLDVGLRLAQEEGALGDHETSASLVKADLKAKEAQIRASISALSTSLRNGTRLADVTVFLEADFARNVVVYVRADNGKELRSRPMDASERQGQLLPETGEGLPTGVTRADGDDDLDDEDTSDEG